MHNHMKVDPPTCTSLYLMATGGDGSHPADIDVVAGDSSHPADIDVVVRQMLVLTRTDACGQGALDP